MLSCPVLEAGKAAKSKAPWRPLRFICLAVGAFLVSLCVTLSCAVQHRDEVVNTRSQQILIHGPAAGEKPTFLAGARFQTVNNWQLLVVTVLPLTSSAPIPPGLVRMLKPGEAALSPVARDIGVGSMFGTPSLNISPGGLESGSEPRVYVRPPEGVKDRTGLNPASGFGFGGEDSPTMVGLGFLNRLPIHDPIALLVATLGFPGLVCLWTGAAMGKNAVRRQTLRMTALGASRVQLNVMRLVDCGAAVLTGLVCGLTAQCLLLTVPIHIRALWENTVLADVRAGLVSFIPPTLVAALAAVVVFAQSVWPPRRRIGRFFSSAERVSTLRLLIFALAGSASLAVPPFVEGGLALLIYTLALVLVALTLPAVVAYVIRQLGAWLTRTRCQWFAAAGLSAGRVLSVRPQQTARRVCGVTLVILLAGHMQMWSSLLSSDYFTGKSVQKVVNGSVFVSNNAPVTPGSVAFQADLAKQSNLLTFRGITTPASDPAKPATVKIAGSCTDLRDVGMVCEPGKEVTTPSRNLSPRVQATLGTLAPPGARIVTSAATGNEGGRDGGSFLVVMSRNGKPVDLVNLMRVSNTHLAGGLQLQSPAAVMVAGGDLDMIRSHWVTAWGVVSVVALLVAISAMLVSELASDAKRLAVIAATKGSPRWLRQHCLFAIGIPVAMAGVVASALYLILPMNMVHLDARMAPSTKLATAFVVLSLTAGSVATLVAERLVQSSSSTNVGRRGSGV